MHRVLYSLFCGLYLRSLLDINIWPPSQRREGYNEGITVRKKTELNKRLQEAKEKEKTNRNGRWWVVKKEDRRGE